MACISPPRPPPLLLSILSLLVCLHLISAQLPGVVLNENQRNRVFFWSADAPLSKAINELVPEVVPIAELILRHAERVEAAVRKALVRERPTHPDDLIKPCDPLVHTQWRLSVNRTHNLRGFAIPEVTCATHLFGVQVEPDENPGYTQDDLYEAIFRRGVLLKEHIRQLAQRVAPNFTDPEFPFNFTYRTVSTRCVLTPTCTYRRRDTWYMGLPLHSDSKFDNLPVGRRQSVVEYAAVTDGKFGNVRPMWLPVYNENESEPRVIRNDTTTLIQSWSRTPNPSCFRLIPVEENPAVLRAIDQADHSAQQVEDALTISNLAILGLPLGFTLIPISLFTDMGTTEMMLYALLSDVLTVVPLGVKGVEMVLIGSRRFRVVGARVPSGGVGDAKKHESGAAEIWGAQCQVREGVVRSGVILISVSLASLVIGITAEIVAHRFARRKRLARFLKTGGDSQTADGSGSEVSQRERVPMLDTTDTVDTIGAAGPAKERYSM